MALQMEGVDFSYPGCAVFSDWSAAAPSGLVAVVGDESSGKTSLLRLLAGELTPQAGRLFLDGQPLPLAGGHCFWADPRQDASEDARTATAWWAQQATTYAGWDAAALVLHTEGFALQSHVDKPFYALSTGTRRKVLMAAALASGARLTLIEEPLAGLDKPSARYLSVALNAVGQNQPDRTVLVAHYDALAGVHWAGVLSLAR